MFKGDKDKIVPIGRGADNVVDGLSSVMGLAVISS